MKFDDEQYYDIPLDDHNVPYVTIEEMQEIYPNAKLGVGEALQCPTILDNGWVEHNGLLVGGLTSGYVMRHRRWLETLTDEERSASRYPRSGGITGIVMTPAELLMERLPDDDWLEEFAETPGYHILLSHHPEYRRLVPKEVELILSGHTHGGQWRAFGRGMFSPGQGMWPKLTKGVYDGRLVVSAGLSNTAPVPRLFNPTEVVYVKG